MSEFTPGPWVLDPDNEHDIRTHEDYWPLGAVEGNLIAYVAHTEDVMGSANARLIAAAPALVAALEFAVHVLEQHNISTDRPTASLRELQRHLETALRKAGVTE